MKPYADDSPMRWRQLALDVGVLLWCYVFVQLATDVHSCVLRLQEPGRDLQGAGNRLAGDLGSAAQRVAGAPLIGGRLSAPLRSAAGASKAVAAAGVSGEQAVAHLALILALIVALVPIGYVLARWLPYRWRYARQAAAAVALRGDVELLALRAASSLPLSRLARLGPEPVARWRRGEPGAAEDLARLELASLGIRPGPPRSLHWSGRAPG